MMSGDTKRFLHLSYCIDKVVNTICIVYYFMVITFH